MQVNKKGKKLVKYFITENIRESFMQHSDWKMLSTLGIVAGALCITGGFIAYQYEATYFGPFGVITHAYPYRAYALPAGFAGAFLIVVGLLADYRAREDIKGQKIEPTTSLGYCPGCGTKRDADSKYCKNCGRKF